MLEFFSANWVWILLVGAMLWMMLGHGGHGGHGGGCGGHQHSHRQQDDALDQRPHEHHEHRMGGEKVPPEQGYPPYTP